MFTGVAKDEVWLVSSETDSTGAGAAKAPTGKINIELININENRRSKTSCVALLRWGRWILNTLSSLDIATVDTDRRVGNCAVCVPYKLL